MLHTLVVLWLWSLGVTSGCLVTVLLVQWMVSAARGLRSHDQPVVVEVLPA